jgi:cold shock CspA family protein
MPCMACQEGFVWSAGEQEFFASKGFTNPPKSCRGNRQARKAQRSSSGNGMNHGSKSASCPYGEGADAGPVSSPPAFRRPAPVVDIEVGVMTTGTVAKVLRDRLFGFIQDDQGIEYYFHQDSVDDDFYALSEGSRVSFVTESSARGPRAVQVNRQ